jgi:hypothetical protein
MASQAVCEHDYEHIHHSHLGLQECMHHPIVFLAEMMGDIMYLHQALRQLDVREFMEAVIKEINGHVNNDQWKLIPCTEVPEDTEVMPSVWAMQCKQDLMTGRVTKYKARLNLHGGKQEFGMNYYDTYVSAVTWFAIQLLIVLAFYSIGPFAKLTLLWPFHKPPLRWTCIWSSPRAFTPSTGIPRTTSSYSPTSTGKSKPAMYRTITLPPSYKMSTSGNLLLTIASSTGMVSFSLSALTMESPGIIRRAFTWHHQQATEPQAVH